MRAKIDKIIHNFFHVPFNDGKIFFSHIKKRGIPKSAKNFLPVILSDLGIAH